MAHRRKLRLRARADRMAETRQRIVRAAYELHRTVGPARTTISAIAAGAGVQRHTVYSHFPDELTLSGACTEYGLSIDPQPDPDGFAAIVDPEERLRRALAEQYAYYRRNDSLLSNVLRDAPLMRQRLAARNVAADAVPEPVRRFLSQPDHLREVLALGWQVRPAARPALHAALRLALDFTTWRSLAAEGLDEEQAAELATRLVVCAAAGSDEHR